MRALREQVESLQSGFAGAKAEIEAAKKHKDKVRGQHKCQPKRKACPSASASPSCGMRTWRGGGAISKCHVPRVTERIFCPPSPVCVMLGFLECQGPGSAGGGEREAQHPPRRGEPVGPWAWPGVRCRGSCLVLCGVQMEAKGRRLEEDLGRMRGDLNDALRSEHRLKEKLKVSTQTHACTSTSLTKHTRSDDQTRSLLNRLLSAREERHICFWILTVGVRLVCQGLNGAGKGEGKTGEPGSRVEELEKRVKVHT